MSELHQMRRLAHQWLDRFWNTAPSHRRTDYRIGTYAWLRRHMKLKAADCHIRLFSIKQCREVIDLCKMAESGLIDKPAARKWTRDSKRRNKQIKRQIRRYQKRLLEQRSDEQCRPS